MKTLIILSAFLLVLSSCNKECPVPDPNPDPTYSTDASPDMGWPPDSGDDDSGDGDSGDDDPSSSRFNNHTGNTAIGIKATSFRND